MCVGSDSPRVDVGLADVHGDVLPMSIVVVVAVVWEERLRQRRAPISRHRFKCCPKIADDSDKSFQLHFCFNFVTFSVNFATFSERAGSRAPDCVWQRGLLNLVIARQ